MRTIQWCGAVAVLALVCGCGGSEQKRVVVTGAVTYNGAPVETGELRLYPKPGTSAPMSGARIESGRFTANSLGGVPVGTFRVEIIAFRGPRRTEGDIEKQTAGTQFLPSKFNSNSELELVVTGNDNPATQDFHLTN